MDTWHTLHDVSESILGNVWGYWGFAIARDGTVWLGTSYGPARLDGEAWSLYTSTDGRGTFFENVAGSQDAAVILMGDMPPFDHISALAADPEGILWVATDRGLARFDGQTWTVFRAGDGPISDQILALAIAPDASLWVGTDAGLSHFDGERWANYPQAAGLLSADLDSLAVAASGTLWGTNVGRGSVFWFDGQSWGMASALEDLDVGEVRSLTAGPDGTIWVGSSNGLSHFDGNRWTHYPLDMDRLPGRGDTSAPGVVALAAAPDGAIWCGTQRGVVRFRPNRSP